MPHQQQEFSYLFQPAYSFTTTLNVSNLTYQLLFSFSSDAA